MKAIRKELGEDESSVELKELEDRVKSAKMSEDAQKVALKELDRLTKIPTQSPEYSVARTYIEWLADLPWNNSTKDQINIEKASSQNDRGTVIAAAPAMRRKVYKTASISASMSIALFSHKEYAIVAT